MVATFEGGELRADEVEARIAEEGPLLAETYATAEGRRKLVERMVRERVLLAHAHRLEYHLRPAVARQCDGAIIGAFLEGEFEEPERRRPVTDEELRAYFAQHRDALARPARVKLAQVFLSAPEGDARREARRKEAAALLAEARKALAKDPGAFASLARRRSEDARTAALGGALPWSTEEQLAQQLGAEPARALFSPGQQAGLIERVFEAPDGLRVLSVLERSDAVSPTYEEARDALRPRLLRERRARAHEAFLKHLEEQARVHIDASALAALATGRSGAAVGSSSP